MIHLPASVRVYLCLTACDMRKSFDGLHALVREHLDLDPFAGHLFVFASRRRDRIKILYWDRDGFAVWSKRLEEGTYKMPFDEAAEHRQEITAQELGALLSGIDLTQAERRKRYQSIRVKRRTPVLFSLGRARVSGYTVTYSWRSIPNTSRKIQRSCSRWCWI